MAKYLLRRILLAIPVVAGVTIIVFLVIHLVPGDPVQMMLGDNASKADIEELRQLLGLNKPLYIQFKDFILNLLQGNLGNSIITKRPVSELLAERFPATLLLSLCSIAVALLISLPLGIVSAWKKNTAIDEISRVLSLLGISIPNFWLGPMLIIIFYINLKIFSITGIILPAITLGTGMAALLTRMIRSTLIDVIEENYIITARSKGLTNLIVISKHALKNALLPVITILGLQFGALLSGAIIVETVFSWPGIGLLTIEAISRRDYPLVQGCILIIATSYVFVNLLTDILYGFFDPRIRYD
ncbi:MAG: ABC transporter permease [Candidatus Schekmanbacteria bacterium]|nr:MAG: ABC transporter permease [Candidatus Schekmanbacteria bacterium]